MSLFEKSAFAFEKRSIDNHQQRLLSHHRAFSRSRLPPSSMLTGTVAFDFERGLTRLLRHDTVNLHGAISIILDRFDLNLPPAHDGSHESS